MTHAIEPRPARAGWRISSLLFAAAPAAAAVAFAAPVPGTFVAFAVPASGTPAAARHLTITATGDPCRVTIESPGVGKAPDCAGD